MSQQQPIYREFGGAASLDEVREWIDRVLDANPDLKPKGIAVSNSLFQQGFNDRYRDVPIAMAEDLYPHVGVRVHFHEPAA